MTVKHERWHEQIRLSKTLITVITGRARSAVRPSGNKENSLKTLDLSSASTEYRDSNYAVVLRNMPPLPPRNVPALQFHIKPATPADIESILRLIKDLVRTRVSEILTLDNPQAEYEKEPESAKATAELVRASALSSRPCI